MSFLDELFFTRLASLIKNDSAVTGATVKEALETLLAGAGGGAVSSVFGRMGAVVAALHDYAASLVDNDSDIPGSTVKDALNAINSYLAALAASNIANDSSISGAAVKDALNVLGSAIAALAASNITNDSSVTGAKVKDALNTLLAAIPSVPVSSVFGRTGAVAAATSDYDASQVDNDSSVSGATVKAALETLAGLVGSSSGSVVLSVLPVSAHADDEEFESGTGVPSGWVLQDSPAESSPATITPSGTPDPYSQPSSGAAKYAQHTSWRKSWGALQPDSQDRRRVFAKPISTITTDAFFWSRVHFPLSPHGDMTSDTWQCAFGLFKDTSGKPDESNGLWVGISQPSQRSGAPFNPIVHFQQAVSGSYTTAASMVFPGPPEYFGIQKVGSNFYGHIWNDAGLHMQFKVLTPGITVGWAGFRLRGASSGDDIAPIFRVDFVRRIDAAQALPF